MIKTEMLNNNTLIRHYSDSKRKLRQIETGYIYDETIDIYPCPYTYEETDELTKEDGNGVIQPQDALDIIFGGM